jgi:hypothetical protein
MVIVEVSIYSFRPYHYVKLSVHIREVTISFWVQFYSAALAQFCERGSSSNRTEGAHSPIVAPKGDISILNRSFGQ